MKAGLQRIKSAHITVNGHLIASSNQGILALIGIEEVDTEDDADSMAKRILQTMLWPEANETQGEWKRNVQEIKGEILCIPHFILHCQPENIATRTPPDMARLIRAQYQYRRFLKQLRDIYEPQRVRDDVFEAMMAGPLSKIAPSGISYESTDSVVTIKIVTKPQGIPALG
ncbi:hypothetical protein ASPVEDRAFT_155120 [Aspergillus versicolor CBS 583.65]|uniref:D-aminoacyl-tRNA deacylase n=1 Tax=Aspergillus versicolor CBS 583.65 TaxID=1036611 RepID=A0A1L9Q0E8_ASPVE|nr:uncharacterized protein ASPVEDRAFT_155120 [Aspergillus versicolor CBS 583.65]OJJ07238.1 hypothetical protein ASPVEDRAFT_155120 [Aspergillus versicolor CBS 583.65]